MAVGRHEFSGQHALVADPVRAMLDIICYRRLAPADMPNFVGSMRIDVDDLGPIGPEQWDVMAETYQHRRMRECIDVLRAELQLLVIERPLECDLGTGGKECAP